MLSIIERNKQRKQLWRRFAYTMRALRKQQGWSTAEAASFLGIHESELLNYENPHTFHNLRIKTFLFFFAVYNRKIDFKIKKS